MENTNEMSPSLSFASASSYLSNGSYSQNITSPTSFETAPNLDLLSLSKLSGSLEKLLIDTEYDYSDAEIEVEGITVAIHRCILASRSPFFQELFKKRNVKNGKPKFRMSELVQPFGWVGHEAFMVFLNYMYTGKLKASPPEVSTCVDDACAHDACLPAINYALELMYASATFQMKELVMLVQRRLVNFVEKAFVEDVIPILVAAHHCQLDQLFSHCVHRVARSDLDSISLEKELPPEVLSNIKKLRQKHQQEVELSMVEMDLVNENKIRRIYKALDSDDVDLVKLLLDESNITLDSAYVLHYASLYCDPKVVSELLNLGMADLSRRNSRGYTVLHVAARRKEPSIIVKLLNKGASVSDTTSDDQTSVTICRRLTRPKDYNEAKKRGQECNKDWLCIDVLEREMRRKPLAGNMSSSSTVLVADDLHMRLLFLEDRVAFAKILFPREAELAMDIAHANSTSVFTGLSTSRSPSGNLREVDLNEIPAEQTKKLLSRLEALQKTVETGRRFFPNCSEVLDKFLEDDMLDAFFLDKGTPEEQRVKKMRFMELKDDVMKAFDKDKAESKWAGLSASSSSSSSPKGAVNYKARKR